MVPPETHLRFCEHLKPNGKLPHARAPEQRRVEEEVELGVVGVPRGGRAGGILRGGGPKLIECA